MPSHYSTTDTYGTPPRELAPPHQASSSSGSATERDDRHTRITSSKRIDSYREECSFALREFTIGQNTRKKNAAAVMMVSVERHATAVARSNAKHGTGDSMPETTEFDTFTISPSPMNPGSRSVARPTTTIPHDENRL